MNAPVVLSDTWAVIAQNNKASVEFLQRFGKDLEYKHIGINRDQDHEYTTLPYAVFTHGKNTFALSLQNMKLILMVCQAMPSNDSYSPIKRNVGHLLNRAVKDYVIHLDHLPQPDTAPRLQKAS